MMTEPTDPWVRPAKPDDLPRIVPIWLELMQAHESTDPRFALSNEAAQSWQTAANQLIERSDAFLLVAQQESEPVGFCLGWVASNPPIYRVAQVGFISEIAVARRARRRGIGTLLIREARRWFAARALNEFQLSTAVWNHAAQRFWEQQGGEALLTRYRFDVEPPDIADATRRRDLW